MFTLRDLINESAYNKLVTSYTETDNYYYDVSVSYDNRNISATQKPTISTSKYYNQYVPYVYRNSRNEYVTMESNMEAILDGIINLIKMYNETLDYATNPFLDTVTIDGDVSDYELKVTDKLFKLTNFTINNSYLTPFKYEVIVDVLDHEDQLTNTKLYSTIDSFPYPKNTYFLTTYSLFTNYILKKVSAEDSNEMTRITDDINELGASLVEIVDTNVLETYIKFDASSEYLEIENVNINDITDDITNFDIANNDGFFSNDITYIKWDTYNQNLLKITGTDLDILEYNVSVDEWETAVVPNTFNVVEDPVTILLDDDIIVTDRVVTVGEYISDDINSYKILTVTDNGDGSCNVTYDKTIVSEDITVGGNFTFNPIVKPDVITTTEETKSAEVNTIVNNLQVFVFDFALSGLEIMDLEYYSISISDVNVDYEVVHDSLLEYITLEQEKIIERGA